MALRAVFKQNLNSLNIFFGTHPISIKLNSGDDLPAISFSQLTVRHPQMQSFETYLKGIVPNFDDTFSTVSIKDSENRELDVEFRLKDTNDAGIFTTVLIAMIENALKSENGFKVFKGTDTIPQSALIKQLNSLKRDLTFFMPVFLKKNFHNLTAESLDQAISKACALYTEHTKFFSSLKFGFSGAEKGIADRVATIREQNKGKSFLELLDAFLNEDSKATTTSFKYYLVFQISRLIAANDKDAADLVVEMKKLVQQAIAEKKAPSLDGPK